MILKNQAGCYELALKKMQQSNFLPNIPIILRNFAEENLIENGKKTRIF